MFRGVFALLDRSLRIDARAWPTHLTRLGLMAAIYASLWFALSTEWMFGAPGLRFFNAVAYLDVTFITLLGIGFFSTAITEEKEEDTLGLMLMAGISPLGILTGKTGGRLWQAVLLLAVQYPFTLLAVTMGGIMPAQIWAATLALTSYTILLGGFGLFCSTIASRSRTASMLLVIGLVFFFSLSSFCKWFSWMHVRWVLGGNRESNIPEFCWTLIQGIGDSCIFLRMAEILTTGFGESSWSIQVVTNAGAGLIFAGLSWLLFGISTRSLSAESSSRGLVAQRRAFMRFAPNRPRGNPFIWKDFHFVAGGVGMMFVRSAYYSAIAGAVLIHEYVANFPQGSGWIDASLMLMSLSVMIDAGIVLARSIHEEMRSQTLSTLLMLPRSAHVMIYSKYAGALIGWLPGPIIELIFSCLTHEGRISLASLTTNENGLGYLIAMLFALIPHFSAVCATYVRWGAVPLAVGLTIGVYFGIVVSMILTGRGLPGSLYFHCLTFVLICICIGCQLGTLLRLQTLAAK